LLKALGDGSITLADLVNVSQYDLSGVKRPRGDVSASISRISRAAKTDRSVVLRETSSSYMFAAAVFYAIKDLDRDRERKLKFVVEPRLEPGFGSCSYDYAIYDPVEGVLKVVAEVKRLRSLANAGEYLEAFIAKTGMCLAAEHIHGVALHIHLTPEVLEEYRGLEGLLLGLSKAVRLSKCRVTLITTSGGKMDEFVQVLRDQMQHII